MLTRSDSKILLRNIGFDENFLERLEPEQSVFLLKREKIRKVNSESAVVRVEKRDLLVKRCREEEDLEAYREMEDCDMYNEREDFKTYYEEANGGEMGAEEEFNNEKDFPGESLENNMNIFSNCSKSQMSQLIKIVSKMNSAKEEKVLVRAYKSKLKSKFYQIYEENSQQFREKIKYKIFHKCNFPSCGRTFASSGWLRSHFQEHLKELKKNKFNILFDNFIVNCKTSYFK